MNFLDNPIFNLIRFLWLEATDPKHRSIDAKLFRIRPIWLFLGLLFVFWLALRGLEMPFVPWTDWVVLVIVLLSALSWTWKKVKPFLFDPFIKAPKLDEPPQQTRIVKHPRSSVARYTHISRWDREKTQPVSNKKDE